MRYLIVFSLLRRCAVSLIYGCAFLDVMLDSKKRHCCDIMFMLLSFLDTVLGFLRLALSTAR